MDKWLLDRILDDLPFAYAYHQMVYDDRGMPVDYQFLEANKAFEALTGLETAKIIGRRVSEIIPGIAQDPADWIGVYAKVVQTRQSITFRQYAQALGKWYNVYAFSPLPDCFVTLFMDVSEVVEEQNELTELFNAMNDIILELDEDLTILRVLMSPDTPVPLPPERMPASLKQLTGMNALQFLESEGVDDFLQAIRQARESGKNTIYYQHMILMGEDAWYQLIIKCAHLRGQRRYIVSIINVTEQKKLEIKLRENEALFQTVFEQAPIGISITTKGQPLYSTVTSGASVNQAYLNILGRTKEELAALDWTDITHPDDLAADLALLSRLLSGQVDHYALEKRYIRPDGSPIWVNMIASTLKYEANQNLSHMCLLEDITARKSLEQSLRESERSKSVLLSHLPGLAYRCLYDEQWTMIFVSDGCLSLTGYQPESLVHNRDLSYNDLISPEYRDLLRSEWARVIEQRLDFRCEYEIITASGQKKWVLEMGQPIFSDSGRVEALEGVVFDISEQKNRELQILFMNEHDDLTKRYNLMYFDKECRRHNLEQTFPLTVVQCDVDGLRLINNAFGIEEGNALLVRVANMLAENNTRGDVLARTGDDDFSLLMPGVGVDVAEDFILRVTACIDASNDIKANLYSTSVSFGYGTRQSPTENVSVTMKAVYDSLNSQKILNAQSSHSATLTSIMAALHARSEETEEHAQRLFELSEMIGKQLGLSQKSMAQLALFSKLHDVGKIGISDSILNKPGPLTPEEWVIMKTHPEIGYRIAVSLEDIAYVAEDILSHHERWDGTGYPRGLRGENIPLPARILAIADAFDAMTKDRVYRKAMKTQDALEEIRRNIGTQFDPKIARLFLDSYR
ncbi:MAG: PAS domain S-box protein [Clostridiales bacterium]|nr:PAS domain S-box protein [Clostridiales bacterium]